MVARVEVFAHDTLVVEVAVDGDWTAWTFAAEARAQRAPNAPLLATFTVDDSGLGAEGGTVRFTVAAATMETVAARSMAVDFRAIRDGVEVTLAAVDFTLTPTVTALPVVVP